MGLSIHRWTPGGRERSQNKKSPLESGLAGWKLFAGRLLFEGLAFLGLLRLHWHAAAGKPAHLILLFRTAGHFGVGPFHHLEVVLVGHGTAPSVNASAVSFMLRETRYQNRPTGPGNQASSRRRNEIIFECALTPRAVARKRPKDLGNQRRPFPIPGATLPGVMMAGEAQAALKASGRVPPGTLALAGSGTLLWQLARQLLNAGAPVAAILDTTPPRNRARALPHLFGFLYSPYFGRGMGLLLAVRRKVPIVRSVHELRAEGDGKLTKVTYRNAGGESCTLPVDTLLLHQGGIPDVTLSQSAGIENRLTHAA